MSTPPQTEARTRMFARVIGPFLVIVTVTAVGRASRMRTLLAEFDANSVWPWVTGALLLLSGLIVIALHQNWRGAAAIIVSLLGWMTTLKGLFLLAFPQTYISAANTAVDGVTWWRTGFVVVALVGLYLTFIGWAPAPSRPDTRADRSTPDLPRAA
jgi:hypothetical protein